MFLEISRLNWASRNLPSGERLPGVSSPCPGSIRIFMSLLATVWDSFCKISDLREILKKMSIFAETVNLYISRFNIH